MPRLIGLVGPAGSGKSIVGRRLIEKHGFRCIRVAEPIKKMLSVGLGLTGEQIDGRLKQTPIPEFGGRTPRQIMQTLGYEWGRRLVHPDLWLTLWQREYERSQGPVVVDDIRFPDEASTVRQLGGAIWRVSRPGVIPTNHPSEKHTREIPADVVIENHGTIPELLLAVDRALS